MVIRYFIIHRLARALYEGNMILAGFNLSLLANERESREVVMIMLIYCLIKRPHKALKRGCPVALLRKRAVF